MKAPLLLALACLAAPAISCRRSNDEAARAQLPPTLRIWISKNGDIELDGEKVDLPRATAAIEDAGRRKGEVLYGQDPLEGQPHPNIGKVFKVLMSSGVNFRFSLNRSFSQFSKGLNPPEGAQAPSPPLK